MEAKNEMQAGGRTVELNRTRTSSFADFDRGDIGGTNSRSNQSDAVELRPRTSSFAGFGCGSSINRGNRNLAQAGGKAAILNRSRTSSVGGSGAAAGYGNGIIFNDVESGEGGATADAAGIPPDDGGGRKLPAPPSISDILLGTVKEEKKEKEGGGGGQQQQGGMDHDRNVRRADEDGDSNHNGAADGGELSINLDLHRAIMNWTHPSIATITSEDEAADAAARRFRSSRRVDDDEESFSFDGSGSDDSSGYKYRSNYDHKKHTPSRKKRNKKQRNSPDSRGYDTFALSSPSTAGASTASPDLAMLSSVQGTFFLPSPWPRSSSSALEASWPPAGEPEYRPVRRRKLPKAPRIEGFPALMEEREEERWRKGRNSRGSSSSISSSAEESGDDEEEVEESWEERIIRENNMILHGSAGGRPSQRTLLPRIPQRQQQQQLPHRRYHYDDHRMKRTPVSTIVLAISMIATFVFICVALGSMDPDYDHYHFSGAGNRSQSGGSTADVDDPDGAYSCDNHPSSTCYDYIVVGGGIGGLIAATSLARAFPRLRVALLESGSASQSSVLQKFEEMDSHLNQQEPNEDEKHADASRRQSAERGPRRSGPSFESSGLNTYDIPLMWSGLASPTPTQSPPLQDGRDNSSSPYWPIMKATLARGLGGNDLISPMIHMRAMPSDFHYYPFINSTLWDFGRDLSPLYDNYEAMMSPIRAGSHPEAGSQLAAEPIGRAFAKSAVSAGHPWLESGFNAKSGINRAPTPPIGVGYYDFNIRNGQRHTIAQALLHGSAWPKNLNVKKALTVTRIVTASSVKPTSKNTGGRPVPVVVGVEYVSRAESHHDTDIPKYGKIYLHQNGEVLLAGGAILTPQLLFQSGIGPARPLANLSGVGSNLQDRRIVAMGFHLSGDNATYDDSMYTLGRRFADYFSALAALQKLETMMPSKNTNTNTTLNQRQHWFRGLGLLGTPGFSTGAFLKSPLAKADSRPDLQLSVFPRPMIKEHANPLQASPDDQQRGEAYYRSRTMVVTVALIRPEARYSIKHVVPPLTRTQRVEHQNVTFSDHITTGDSMFSQLGTPSIELESDLSTGDIQRLAWGVEHVRNILKLPPVSDYIQGEQYPKATSIDQLHSYIRRYNFRGNEWVGTTKMGRPGDEVAVVDDRLRVRGVRGLRVVDAGVLPTLPTTGLHGTVYAIARRAADFIAHERNGNFSARDDRE